MLELKNSKLSGRQYREETSKKISWGHWFAFFNVIIAIVIGARYAFLIDWPDTLFGRVYFFISLLGHFSFSIFAIYLLLVFPLSFIVKNNRTFRGLAVIIATIGTTLLLFDTQVFNRFNLHLSSLVWNLLVNPEKGELSRDWQLFFAPMPIILLAQMIFSRWSWEKLRSLERQKWLKFVGATFTLCFIGTHLIYAWADAFLYRPITMQRSNFPLSYPMTARTFLEKHGFIDRAEYAQKLALEGRPEALKINYPKHQLEFFPTAQSKNLLIITISGLRYDAVTDNKMPNLSEFARKARQFTNHYSSGNNDNAGLVGLFYGLNANYTDSILNNHTQSVLIQKLNEEKYQFALFSSDRFKENLFRQALFRGMDLSRSNKEGNESAVNNLLKFFAADSSDKNWFAYLDLALNGSNPTAYRQSLAQMDEQIGKVLNHIPMENTFVVITAPHGLSFHTNVEDDTNYFGRDEIQVPMIIYSKTLAPKQENVLTGHTDLLPTIMSALFEVRNPASDYAQGRNLFSPENDNSWVLASNYRWNVIIQADGTQYHLDREGNYKKFDDNYQPQSSSRPPLGLFLDVFKQERSFFDK